MTKRLCAIVGAIVLLLNCAITFTSCDKTAISDEDQDTQTMTYSSEYYVSAFREFFTYHYGYEPPSRYQLTSIVFYYNLPDANQDRPTCDAYIYYSDGDGLDDFHKSVQAEDCSLSEEQFVKLRNSLPDYAVTYHSKNTFNEYYYFRVELAMLDEKDKAKVCKIFFDRYIELHPDVLADLKTEG